MRNRCTSRCDWHKTNLRRRQIVHVLAGTAASNQINFAVWLLIIAKTGNLVSWCLWPKQAVVSSAQIEIGARRFDTNRTAHLCPMTVTIPDEALGPRFSTPEKVRLELAVALFANNEASVARAARIAGLNHLEMQRELGKRKIPMHYGIEDFEQDLRTLRDWPLP